MFPNISRTTITTPPCPSSVDSRFLYQEVEELSYTDIQLTLAVIKPEAYVHAETIIKIINNEGFKILQKRTVNLTPEQACEFYFQHYGNLDFPKMVVSVSDGPIIALALGRENAITYWKSLLGPADVLTAKQLFPTCLRSHFGDLERNRNGLHGSESLDEAEREIHFFFPKLIMQPMRTEEERVNYLKEMLNPTLLKGLVELCKAKPADPILWLADWLLDNNPYQPKMHPELQQIPT